MLAQVLGTEDRKVLQTLFDYLFRKINKYQYRDQLVDRKFAKELWARAEPSGYVMRNCKLYVYARYVAHRAGKKVRAADFEIDAADVKLLNRIEVLIPKKYPAMTLAQFVEAEQYALTSKDVDLDAYMGRFVNKKMLFLMRSYGLTMDGLKASFIDNALYAMRKQYPFFHNELHMLNVCKTAIHNCGQSTISYWTREKRNALIREDDGSFSAVHVDLDVAQMMGPIGVVDARDDPHQQNLQSLRSCGASLGPRARHFINIASGNFDAGFSMYLGQRNTDVVESWAYDRYLRSLCTYLKLKEHQVQRLLEHMRKIV